MPHHEHTATAAPGTAEPGRRSVDEHRRIVADLLAGVAPSSERVPLDGALGRVTAAAVTSPVDLPLFRNSQMDGFAVAAASLTTIPAVLPVSATIAAAPGAPEVLPEGAAARIMTGAPVPLGADCVVPVEYTSASPDGVVVERGQEAGDYVREPGSDIRSGSRLLDGGVLLAPRHLAALAASGIAGVEVRGRVRVAIISSGAELIAPGASVLPGQVFDANTSALAAAAEEAGAAVVSVMRTGDDAEEFRAALAGAVAAADVVLTSGGVSKGSFEVVRDVLEPLGADVTEVAMQPGGPQCTAVVDGVPIVSFPGNPVSAQVSFAVFLRPVLRKLAGLPSIASVATVLSHPIDSAAGKRQWLRGIRDGARVTVVSGPGSHLVATMATADCLVDVPEATTRLEAGDTVEVLPL